MNIIGYDFLCDDSSFRTYADIHEDCGQVQLQNGIYDEIVISNNVLDYMKTMPDAWNNNTILHAFFDGDLIAGNIVYKAEIISKMRVKRREVGKSQWMTLIEYPINKPEDFEFTYIDRYAKAAEYEYGVIPMIGENEQNYTTKTVQSKFDGIFVCDKENNYYSLADVSIPTIVRNRPNSVVTTLENKYPYVVYNGMTNYESGTVTGIFVEIDWDVGKFKIDDIPKFSQEVMSFLANGRPKILKTWDGRIWMVDITDTPTASVGSYPKQVMVSFSFAEIGNVESSNDMYNNAFIDLNVERS